MAPVNVLTFVATAISGKGTLNFSEIGIVDTSALNAERGDLLLEPKNITISNRQWYLEVEEPLSQPNATDKKIVPLDENCNSIPKLVIETEAP